MAHNRNLNTAQQAKYDEFYTQLPDIENELQYYRSHFKGKTVYCNCDDPMMSNFWKFFSLQFEWLELKKLMATCYKNPSPDLFSDHTAERSFYLEYLGDQNDNRVPDPEEIKKEYLQGDGDFASFECIELLKEADIVVTNPPFSLFRKYVSQLVKYDKKFLIVGNQNSITYKEIFPLIKENRMWLGVTNVAEFAIPSHYPLTASSHRITEDGIRIIKANGAKWFTNLPHKKQNEELVLIRRYSPEKYPHYENCDAINVDMVADIPEDWDGVMGVPITFLDKYNPDQFEILGIGIAKLGLSAGVKPFTREHKKYRREVQKRGAVDGDLYMMEDGEVKVPYRRILIRNKQFCKKT